MIGAIQPTRMQYYPKTPKPHEVNWYVWVDIINELINGELWGVAHNSGSLSDVLLGDPGTPQSGRSHFKSLFGTPRKIHFLKFLYQIF